MKGVVLLFLCFVIRECLGRSVVQPEIDDIQEILSRKSSTCFINLATSSPKYIPFLVDSQGNFLYPSQESDKNILQVEGDEEITVACPGPKNVLKQTGTPSASASCDGDSSFIINKSTVPFLSLSCKKKVKEEIVNTGTCGPHNEFTAVQIAWRVGETLNPQIDICYDEKAEATIRTSHTVHGKAINARFIDKRRPGFKEGNFYDTINVNSYYKVQKQYQILGNLLGSSSLAKKLIDVHKSFYFARGHLSPDADFIYDAQQDGTYYYFNAAPQWQSFNNGNWKYLENAVRKYADRVQADVKVYTGTHGVLTLPDVNGNEKEIWLYTDENGRGHVPAPKFYWKVVHDIKRKKAIAFVGVNNPHISELTSDYVLCKDRCDTISWVTWKVKDYVKGYMYCCKVSDLRAKIPTVPRLKRVGILKD